MEEKEAEILSKTFRKFENLYLYHKEDNVLEDDPAKAHLKQKCYAMMHLSDVFSINDPSKITPDKLKELLLMFIELLIREEVTKEICTNQHKRILEIGLTTLPVTDYIKNKLKAKYPNEEI